MKQVSLIFGTRPEAIKLCPLVLALRQHSFLRPHVCVTGQHRHLLDQVLAVFGVSPDADLSLMQPNQPLAALTSRAVAAVDAYLAEYTPDVVVVQGDTTSVLAAALAAFYRQIPVAHVEAGLRTWNKLSPFPEEVNRVLTTRIADYHFAPTSWAGNNLLGEGIPPDRVFVTGNTVIDALHLAIGRIRQRPPEIPGLDAAVSSSHARLVLITGHRRENFGEGFESICVAIAELGRRFPDVQFVYPVHLNPNVQEPVRRILGRGHPNVRLIEPLAYLPFVALLDRCTLVITDSGGVQEEAPSLGKPVLVLRDTTERPEAVEAGTVKLVGTDKELIVAEATRLLTDESAYQSMARAQNPYGDGLATGRIIKVLERIFEPERTEPSGSEADAAAQVRVARG